MSATRPTLLLVSPPALHARSWWTRSVGDRPHLYSLAGSVREVVETRVLELDASGADGAVPEALEQALDGIDVGLVGISCWTSLQYLGSVAIARYVREQRPDLPIVVGGHHATALPSDFITGEGLFDYVVRGDGEHALRDLCDARPRRPPAPVVLDGRPFEMADPSHVDWARYAPASQGGGQLWVCLSRGCVYQCGFCVEPSRGRRWAAYRVADALDVVERLVESHAPRALCFSDALFGADPRWTEGFLSGLSERQLPTMFWAETRADRMTPALLDRLQALRFKVDFGLDTGSATMVARMGKSASPERYLSRSRETLTHANRIGLHHDIYLLFNHPGETLETARETKTFVAELGAGEGPMSAWVSSQTFFILPGTGIYDRMDQARAEWGTEFRNPGWWRQAGDHHRLASDVLPSAAYAGLEYRLPTFMAWQRKLNTRWPARYPPEVRAFRRAFFG